MGLQWEQKIDDGSHARQGQRVLLNNLNDRTTPNGCATRYGVPPTEAPHGWQLAVVQALRYASRMSAVRRAIAAMMLVSCLAGGCDGSRSGTADVLLFAGTGTSPNDVRAIEALLAARGIRYSQAGSTEIDAMSADDPRAHCLLIAPGRKFGR